MLPDVLPDVLGKKEVIAGETDGNDRALDGTANYSGNSPTPECEAKDHLPLGSRWFPTCLFFGSRKKKVLADRSGCTTLLVGRALFENRGGSK